MSKKEPIRPHNIQVPNTPKSISSISWGTTSDLLACTSWNSDVCLYNIQYQQVQQQVQQLNPMQPPPVNIQPIAHYTHGTSGQPILSSCITAQNQVWTSGADGEIRMYQIGGPQQGGGGDQTKLVGKHNSGVKNLLFSDEMGVAVSGGWDKCVKYWDVRQANANVLSVNSPTNSKIFCMSHCGQLLSVGFSDGKIAFYDLRSPQQQMEVVETTLKHQLRCMANFRGNSDCVVVGSIEGRAAIQYLRDSPPPNKKSFAFKCHRVGTAPVDVFAVNAVSVHPVYNTFSTAGGDGSFTFWDKDAKQKLQHFIRAHPSLPIVSTGFNRTGHVFAYACAYDWSQGAEVATEEAALYLHMPTEEIKNHK